MNKKHGFIALLSSALVYATIGIFAKQLSRSFGSFTQASVRSFFSVFLLIIWLVYKKTSLKLKKVNKLKLAIYAITTPFSIAAFSHAINYIKVANAIFYIYLGIYLSTVVIGTIFYKEKLTLPKIFALILGFMGLIIFSYPLNISFLNPGVWLAITAGLLDGLSMALCKYLGSFKRDVLLFYNYSAGLIITLLMAFVSKEQMFGTILLPSIIAGLILGFNQIAIGALYLYGLANFDLNLGTIIVSSELIFMLILNAIFLKEYPISTELIGGALIFLAITLVDTSLYTKKIISGVKLKK